MICKEQKVSICFLLKFLFGIFKDLLIYDTVEQLHLE